MDNFTWLKHAETGGYFECPDAAVDDMREKGWEPSDPPVPIDPTVAEQLAWREQQAAALAAETTKPNKAAPRGDNEGVSVDG